MKKFQEENGKEIVFIQGKDLRFLDAQSRTPSSVKKLINFNSININKQEEYFEFDFYPNLEDRTAEVVIYTGTDKDIVIPEKIYGLEVVGLDENFCTYNMDPADVNSITVANTIKSIPHNCFDSFSNLSKVILGESIEEIGDHAFGYRATDSGYAPIDGFTIYGYAGTAAETYANANGFRFVDLSVTAQVA